MKKMLCLVLVLLTVLSSCVSASADSRLDTAIAYYEYGYYKKAEQLFLELGREGNVIACAYLANIYNNNFTNSASAKADYLFWSDKADKIMDDMYKENIALREKDDYAGAAEILEVLVLFNHPKALNDLAVYYKNGLGVTKDLAVSFEYMSRAAALDHPTSVYNMGIYYENGHYVQKDLETALSYFERANELGYEKAADAIERVKKAMATTTTSGCKTCGGSKVCYLCKGSKKQMGVDCFVCEATGRCPNCTIIIKHKCGVCNDTRKCTACAGFGHILGETCKACDGKRSCKYCRNSY